MLAHCDGGARGNPGPAGYGAVVTDAEGRKLAELSDFLGVTTNNVAEYSGLLAVLAWALEHGHRRLRVVSDSLLMVNQIRGRFKVNSPDLRPLWEEARRRIGRLEAFEISHALRHKNKDADRLANEAMDRGTGRPAAGRPQPAGKRPESGGSRAQVSGSSRQPGGSGVTRATASPVPPPGSTAARPQAALRGFVRGGSVHLLDNAQLPDGTFVRIIPE